jgi:integrase
MPAQGLHVDRSRLTIGQYLRDHWLPTRDAQHRPSTVEAYTVAVEKWIIPRLGAIRLQLLEPAMVSQFIGSMLADGRSPKYVRNIHGVLRKALADARRLGLVRTNAAADVEFPQVCRGDLRAWGADQIGRVPPSHRERPSGAVVAFPDRHRNPSRRSTRAAMV